MPETIIRVGIVNTAKSFNLSCAGKYYVYELSAGRKSYIKPMDDYLVKGIKNKITLGNIVFTSPLRLVVEERGSYLRVNGRLYRDNIYISCVDGRFTVINELGIEDYLFGILPKEVSPEWAFESLKAQAVVSRTYVLRNLRKHLKNGFDVCNNTHCQVYGGMDSENKTTNEAVKLTRGEVLVYKSELAQTLFHAACGGFTEDPRYVWSWNNTPPQYLSGRPDRFCQDSHHNYWKNNISASIIGVKLRKAGYKVGAIYNISMSGKNKSGRTKILKIKHSKGSLDVNAAKFRLAVDPWLMKSTLLKSVKKSGNNFEFIGRGWGHGVGMCQWGAKGMAEKKYSYKKILEYFYPGSKIEKWDE